MMIARIQRYSHLALGCAALLAAPSLLAQSSTATAASELNKLEQLSASNTEPAASNSGLNVNEVRIKGRRDAVEVQRKNGSIDYYSSKSGIYSGDDSDGLGTHSALRTWRFGGN